MTKAGSHGNWPAGCAFRVAAAALVALAARGAAEAAAPAPARAVGGDPIARASDAAHARLRRFAARTPASPAPAKPPGVDLDALYIQMTPLYHAYCLDYSSGLPQLCAGTENDKRWPDRGEPATFTAHYMNKGTVDSGPFEYTWAIDDVEVARGSFAGLGPGMGSTAAFVWPWGHDVVNGRLLGQHTVRFTLDPDGKVTETNRSNNAIEDRTDATPLGFQVTPEVYEALETPVDPSLPFSAEDWVQKQFRAMNEAFARSVHPTTPGGCEERVRLDQFRVTSQRVPNDGGIGGWFLDCDDRYNGSIDPGTDIDGPMLHELGHQLGISDIYTLQIDWLVPHRVLDQTGRPVLMEQLAAYRSGLMANPGIEPPRFDEETAGGMNRNKGYRRGYFGEYMWDVPPQVKVRVLDNRGAPAPNVSLRLFRMAQFIAEDGANDDTPEMSVVTDDEGTAVLPNRSAGPAITTATGHALVASPIGPIDLGGDDTFLVEIGKGPHREWRWVDVTDLNLLAWSGGDTLEFASHVPGAGAPEPPAFLSGVEQGGAVILSWGPSPTSQAQRYTVYATAEPRGAWTPIADAGPALSGRFPVDRNVVGFAVTAVDGNGRESGFSEPYWAMRLQGPNGIAIDAGNRRFLRQWDSVIVQGGDEHFLNLVRGAEPDHGHVALDPDGRLLVCRRDSGSVAVVDPAGDPRYNLLFELPEPGAGLSLRPTGVAATGPALAWGGPYGSDGKTTLLCHFDGTRVSESGVAGYGGGLTFPAGRYGQGVAIVQPATLSYPIGKAFAAAEGAVEFWVRPGWRADDRTGHIFLAVDGAPGDAVHIEKDGAANLRTIVWNGGRECGVGVSVAAWQRAEWHHVAVAWRGTELRLVVDGSPAGYTGSCGFPRDLAGNAWFGSGEDGDRPADSVFDELRVSTVARAGNSDTAGRILVADGAGDRLVAFDLLGQAVGTYGSTGGGQGQLRSPAGIASDGAGRVVVVDAGNRRLQLFGFDGAAFTFIREIAGDLLDPDGVAFRGNRIVVADTGRSLVKVFSDEGELIATYDGPNDGAQSGPFSQPRDVAVDVAGRIVVADTGNNRVVSVIHEEPHAVRRRLRRAP